MKLLQYYSPCFLDCAKCQSDVLLCISPTLTANGGPSINGTIASVQKKNCNSTCTYFYTIQYDEAQLEDPDSNLTQADILSIVCKECMIEYALFVLVNALQNITISNLEITGNVANDVVDVGNPVKIGYKAISYGTTPIAVASGDRVDAYADVSGIPFVIGGHPDVLTIEAAYTTSQTDTAIVSVSPGGKIIVTAIDFVCSNANTVNVGVRIGFGTTNTPTTTGVVLSHPGIAPGSGVIRGNGSGILGVGTDAQDLRITCDAPTTGSARVVVSYYLIAT